MKKIIPEVNSMDWKGQNKGVSMKVLMPFLHYRIRVSKALY